MLQLKKTKEELEKLMADKEKQYQSGEEELSKLQEENQELKIELMNAEGEKEQLDEKILKL